MGTNDNNKLARWAIALVLGVLAVLSAFAAGMTTMWHAQPVIAAAIRHGAPAVQATSPSGDGTPSADRGALLWDIQSILEKEYVNPSKLDEQQLLYGAAHGMVDALGDRHTQFVEPVQAKILDEDMTGSFEGIGATVTMIDGRLVLAEILPESPALKAGLKADDVVLEVDGVPLAGKSELDAISLIRGPKGTVVRLLIERPAVDEPFVVPVTRDKVELLTVETRILDGNVAYLRLTEFNAVSTKRVRNGLRSLLREKPVGLILDLRGNPGGYLQMAVDIASEFLPADTLVLTEEERDAPAKEYRASRGGLATDIPLVVLVDGGSASAAEIVAGAIQDHGRAQLVGMPTYGKGSVQITHTLKDQSSLRVTIALWFLPNHETLDGVGLQPDIQVEYTADDRSADQDPQLERALSELLGVDRS
jgi:carboxyl-terminal processing protease